MNNTLGLLILAALLAGTAFGQQSPFTKITDGDIVNDVGVFTGCAWGDFRNNGYLDLFVCNYAGTNLLYLNSQKGTFNRVVQGDPFRDSDAHLGAAVADYDNDGYLDLIVAAGGHADSAESSVLYHNTGDGTLSKVSGSALGNQLGFFWSPAWADYDNDGHVDLFITDEGDSNGVGGKNLLLHNQGDGTFGQVTSGSIVNDITASRCAVWVDYDNDGYMDLLVLNANPPHNLLYHNNRDGTFTRVLTNAIATDQWPSGAFNGAWGDYDNDGLPDLFVTDLGGATNRLYHNNGNGVFANVTDAPMLSMSLPDGANANGAAWGDYDNDGYLDLVVSFAGAPNALFHNNGDGTFTQILSGDPTYDGGPGIVAATCSWVDYDNDGFLDLFISANTQLGHAPIPNLLYHNNGNTNGWLKVNLIGTVSNRSAIGAKVRVRATIGGKTFWQMREINTGGGRNVMPLVAHFGLGDATNIDTVRIEWPSGTIQELHNQAPKKTLTITEPPRLTVSQTSGTPLFFLKGGRGLQYRIETSTDLTTWSPMGSVTITNLAGTAEITQTNAVLASRRFYRAVMP